MKSLDARFLLLAMLPCCAAIAEAPFQEDPRVAQAFEEAGATGVFVMLDPRSGSLIGHNRKRAQERFVPASTFKIANTLIGLDCGAVEGVDEVLPYGGKPQPFPQWERDMSLRHAIAISNVPVYQELARRIGREQMRRGLERLDYGNREIGGAIDRFWLDGPLKISATEQVEFLRRLAADELPIRSEAMAAAREILRQEPGRNLFAKTGWAMDIEPQIGWFVGWVERSDGVFPFALNIEILAEREGAIRVPLATRCLEILGASPDK